MYPKKFPFTQPLYLKTKRLKGQFEIPKNFQYLNFKRGIIYTSAFFLLSYILYNSSTEFNTLQYPNFLIPQFIYNSRLDHHKVWELSRLAQKKPNLFSHYYYDDESDFVYYIDQQGNQRTQKNNLSFEKLETLHNPEFEIYVRDYRATGNLKSRVKGNLLIAYTLNIHNQRDLANYLFQKTLTLGDWIRGFFWGFMVYTNFTNYYRYDHIIRKPNIIYEYDKVKLLLNIGYKSEENDVLSKYKMIAKTLKKNFIE